MHNRPLKFFLLLSSPRFRDRGTGSITLSLSEPHSPTREPGGGEAKQPAKNTSLHLNRFDLCGSGTCYKVQLPGVDATVSITQPNGKPLHPAKRCHVATNSNMAAATEACKHPLSAKGKGLGAATVETVYKRFERSKIICYTSPRKR